VPFRDSKILLDLASLSEFEAHRLELENSDAKGKNTLGITGKALKAILSSLRSTANG